MPRFWIRHPDTLDWAALEPAASMLALKSAPEPLTPLDSVAELPRDAAGLLLCPPGSATGLDVFLLSSPDSRTRLNGVPAASSGIRRLHDMDALDVGLGAPIYISTAQRPVVESFPGADAPVFCPRCQQPIPEGEPAVRCPGCRSWFHQSEAQPCWDYADTCLLCPQPTSLDEDLRWTPHELVSECHG